MNQAVPPIGHATVPTLGPSMGGLSPWGVGRRLLRISPREVTTERRRFCVDDPQKKHRIELVGSSFLQGYHFALESASLVSLSQQLAGTPLEYQGFAYEGAAMAIALLDRLLPWRSAQLPPFLATDDNVYPYLTHVGVGWALARIPGAMARLANTLASESQCVHDPQVPMSVLACLALDGYGFHQAYFAWERFVKAMVEPSFLTAAALPVFRQGVGRSLVFVLGMSAVRIPACIARFPSSCQGDLWSGVGLAAAYAGGWTSQEVQALLESAGSHRPGLAQGVAFAVKARQRAHVVPAHTHLVCERVWQRPVGLVAQLCDTTLAELPSMPLLTVYALWRQRIQDAYAAFHP
jgi:hypothetical protein